MRRTAEGYKVLYTGDTRPCDGLQALGRSVQKLLDWWQCCGSGIRYLCTPGSGMDKKSRSGFGIPRALKQFFLYLNSLMRIRIRDPESFFHWIRDGKIRIRDLGSGINIPDPQHCLVRWIDSMTGCWNRMMVYDGMTGLDSGIRWWDGIAWCDGIAWRGWIAWWDGIACWGGMVEQDNGAAWRDGMIRRDDGTERQTGWINGMGFTWR